MSWLCRIGIHKWPRIWTEIGKRTLIQQDGIWFKIYEKRCDRAGCEARLTLDGPLRYPPDLGGEILSDEMGRYRAQDWIRHA